MTAVAGVDYSTRALHAAIVGDKQLRFVKRYDLGADPVPQMRLMLADLQRRGVTQCWLEAPFMIPARLDKETGRIVQRSNVNTLKLHRVPTQVETLASLLDPPLPVRYVAPATWKSVILTGVPAQGTKAQSLWFVRRAFGYDAQGDDNLSDAVCLAEYGEALARFNGHIPTPPTL